MRVTRVLTIALAILGGLGILLVVLAIFVGGNSKDQQLNSNEAPSSKLQAPISNSESPLTPDEQFVQGIIFQGTAADVSLRFVEARMLTEDLFKRAPTLDRDARIAFLDQALVKWQEARDAASRFSEAADFFASNQPTAQKKYPVSSIEYPVSSIGYRVANSLVPAASAATAEETIKMLDEELRRTEGSIKVSEKERELGRKKILEIIDQAPQGGRVKKAAELFGIDAKTAYEELTKMRNLEAKIALGQEEVLGTYTKTAQAVKTASAVAVFVIAAAPAVGGAGLALAGGTYGTTATLGNIAVTSVLGAGLVMQASETAVSIGLASEKGLTAKIANAQDAPFFKQMSFVAGIVDPIKSIGSLQKLATTAGGWSKLLTREGTNAIAKNTQLMGDVKGDTAGNLLTIADAGPKALEALGMMKEKAGEVKTLIFGPAPKPGEEPAIQTLNEPIVITETAAIAPAVQAAIQQMLTGAAVQGTLGVPLPSAPTAPPPEETPKPSFDGTYSGSTEAASGFASVSMSVRGESLSGRASYRETSEGQTFRIGLTLSGSVNEEGRVSGRLSGSQSVGDRTVTVSGSFSGSISGNTMSVRYRGSSSATGDVSGSVTLTK